MKRSKTRMILLVVVVAASLASYIYLNNTEATQAQGDNLEQTEIDENFKQGDSKMVLPDVEMIKKVLETGKRLIPAS
jgi:hypothetical protein